MADFRATAMSGSLTRLVNATSYLVAGSGVTIESGSGGVPGTGQIRISATGGGGSSEWTRNGNNIYPNSPTTTNVYFGDTDGGSWDTLIGPDGSATFNERGAAVDFRIEGDTKTHLFFVDGSTDRIGIGTSIPEALLNVTTNDENGTIVALEQHHDSTDAPNMNFVKSRGNNASPTTITSGDFIGDIQFNARDTNSTDTWARIYARSYGTVSNTSHPSKIHILATPNGSVSNQAAAIFGGHSAGSPYGTISGSIHWTVGGIPYLVGSQGVSISSASNGQVTISTPTASDTTYTLTATQDGDNVDVLLDASAGSDSTLQLTAGANVTLTRNSAAEVTIAAAADTDTTYTLSATQDGSDVDILLDASTGSDSTLQLTAGSNITLTRSAADNITIAAAADTDTTYTLSATQDGDNVDILLDASAGSDSTLELTAGPNITLTRNASDRVTVTATDTNTTYSAGSGLDLGGTTFSVDVSDFLTNGANNRIVTATGTDGFNAESNLTFDGSNLIMTGTMHVQSTGLGAAISIDKGDDDTAVLRFGVEPEDGHTAGSNRVGYDLVYSGSGSGVDNEFVIIGRDNDGKPQEALVFKTHGSARFEKNLFLMSNAYVTGSFIVDGADNTFVVDPGTNRVGIRKAVPSTALHMKGDFTIEDQDSTDTIAKIYDSSDDGVLDLYANNSVKARIHGNGLSYFTGNDGRVALGDVGASYLASPDNLLMVTSDTNGQTILSVEQHNNGGDAPNFNFVKSRGTQEAPAAINSGDFLGEMAFKGYVGGTAGEAAFASIYAESHGTIGDNSSHPGRLILRTVKTNSTSYSEVMALSGSGVNVTPTLKTNSAREVEIRNQAISNTSVTLQASDHYVTLGTGASSVGVSTRVMLPQATTGRSLWLRNMTKFDLRIWAYGAPGSSDTIEGGGAGSTPGFTIATNGIVHFVAENNTNWLVFNSSGG